MPLPELERQLEWAAAGRRRPRPFIDRADYSATLVDGELRDARVEWHVQRPDSFLSMLPVGRMNLNVSGLEWFDTSPATQAPTKRAPALWGTIPDGSTAIVVDRRQGRLVGEWSLSPRKLAASVEFDLELPPATVSHLALKIPKGLVLSSSAGDVAPTELTAEPGWKQWQVHLGSRTTVRLRIASAAAATTARPLIVVRSNLNYVVRTEAVRVLAEFSVEPLETRLRELPLEVDPEIQITSVEYGDGGTAPWKSTGEPAGAPNRSRDGGNIVVQLPDSPAGDVQSLRILGIAQIKPFAAWTLPRIRVQDSVEDAGKLTLRIQPPLEAADVRADGYLQTELTTSAADGDTLVFRQLRRDGTITLVPADGKPDLACRVATLVTSENNQWTLISQMEWTAASGRAFAIQCLIPDQWEIVDVRPAPGENSATLAGWDVAELGPDRRVLHVFFSNALDPDRPQRLRIAARRLPPGPGEQTALPPLNPSDAEDVEQFVVVTTGPEWRPVVESTTEIERLTIRDLPEEVRRIDFLGSRLSDRHSHLVAFRTLRPSATARLSIEPFERASVFRTHSEGLSSPADFQPDSPSEPESAATREPAPAARDLPVSMHVRLQVSDLPTGFDHYRARVRVVVVDGRLTFRWTLAEPAELIGVTIGGRQVSPLARNGSYSIEALPIVSENGQQDEIRTNAPTEEFAEDISIVELDYRVPATMHAGRNRRKLVLPVPAGPVLHFDLELAVSDRIRLAAQPTGLRLAGFDERFPWQNRLLGPFARHAGTPVFNPFSLASWSRLPLFGGSDAPIAGSAEREHVWKAASPSLPEGAEFAIWNADESTCLSIGALACCALVTIGMRLARSAMQRKAACLAILCLCLGALTLPAVEAEIAGSALTGLIIAALLPQRALEFARTPALQQAEEIPVGSTQSFIPLASVVLAAVLLGGDALGRGIVELSQTAHAQDDRKPLANTPVPNSPVANSDALAGKTNRPTFDVLIPVDSAGQPAGEIPLAYLSKERLALLSRSALAAGLPPYLIGSVIFDGHVDESNRLLVLARFDVHIFATDPAVRVHLPIGKVNLGGADACLVNGRPHPVIASSQGTGLWLDLPGCEPRSASPAVPSVGLNDRELADGELPERELPDEPTQVRTCHIEFRLYPPVSEAGRTDVSSALVTIPPGCRTQASLSASADLPVLDVIPIDVTRPSGSQRQPAPASARSRPAPDRTESERPGPEQTGRNHVVRIRPVWNYRLANQTDSNQTAPSGQLLFRWSAVPRADIPPAAEMQVGISCLADVAPEIVQLRYHIAYHLQSGQVDSLVWYVPPGYVLQSVQATQLAGYRFRPGPGGARELLLEFSRPQEEDFSLAATFALTIDRQVKPLPLPLLDPLSSENGMEKHINLRFHQFALRQPADLGIVVSAPVSDPVSAAERDQGLKPRPVKEFLKEWNAAGARPQQAFDLARLFALQLDIENLPAQPGVRASAEGHFRPGRLDWIYTAEIERTAVGQFVYRLHVDPRLKIRAVSVQEDGAERLLRSSLLRDTLVILLNDPATKIQTLRIDASLPLATSQQIELPRIRLAGTTPGPEHITLYRDPDLAVRLANPDDFSRPQTAAPSGTPTTADERGSSLGREQLVAKFDCLPDQAYPRVDVEPVLPQIVVETAFVVGNDARSWQLTTCVRFQVNSGEAESFKFTIPESMASDIDVRSTPTSRTIAETPVDGRITLVFHPDQPVGNDPFVVVLTGKAEFSSEAWQLPALEFPGAAQTDTLLMVPHSMAANAVDSNQALEAIDANLQPESFAVPEWIKAAIPAALAAKGGPGWKIYRWPGAAPQAEFRTAQASSVASGVDSARIDLWVQPDGSITGWLGLNLSKDVPSTIEFDWPMGIDLMALSIAGEFVALPVVEPRSSESRNWTVALPATTKTDRVKTDRARNDLVWLSWRDLRKSLPPVSGPQLAARVPWPRSVPVARCTVNLHAPVHCRIDASSPSAATFAQSPSDSLPSLVARDEVRDASPGAEISLAVSPARHQKAGVEAAAEAGARTGLELPTALRIVDELPRDLALSLAGSLLISLLCWKTARFWSWLTRHETTAWIVLSIVWCLWLDPSWVGPLVGLCACLRALFRRERASV